MTKARNIADLLDANGDVKTSSLDNVPASNDASALTTGTLPNARLPNNISDGGTEGTKVAVGTTAQRGSTVGQWRFNSTTGFFEGYNGSTFSTLEPDPTISSISPSTATDANTSITITGNNFYSGTTVKFIGNDGTEYNSPSVTVDSVTQITATTPSTVLTVANEPYDVRVISSTNKVGTLADALDAGGLPTWNTASGNIKTGIERETVNVSVSATDPDGQTVSYSETTSVLSGIGLSLNSSTGAITGILPASSSTSGTTNTFTIRGSDGTNITDRTFNIISKDAGDANLWGWWKSEDIGNGTSLNSTWNDSSGNNRHLTLVGSALTYTASDSNFNNQQSVGHLSASTGNYYWHNGSPISYNQDHTGMVVMRRTATQNHNYGDGLMIWNISGSLTDGSWSHDWNGDHSWGNGYGENFSPDTSNTNRFTNETLSFMTTRDASSGSSWQYNLLRNGTNSWSTYKTASPTFNFNATWDRFSLFNFIHATHGGHAYLGYIAECVWFKGTRISDAQRNNWKDYFKEKFGI